MANAVATGVVTILLMKASGYKPHHAGAIEAVASSRGQLMPPVAGDSAFIMAELLGIPYSAVVIAALVPAVLYCVALFVQADLEPAKSDIAPVDRSQLRPVPTVLTEGWFFPIPVAVLAVCGLLRGDNGRRMRWGDIVGIAGFMTRPIGLAGRALFCASGIAR